jgi:plasmid stabilization system protein ParE
MPGRTVLSAAAQQDLIEITDWLLQPGSGPRAHRSLEDIRKGIEELPETFARYPTEPDKPGCRIAIIRRHAVRFRRRANGSIFVLRVFGPGRVR